jgi:hypothetical protein
VVERADAGPEERGIIRKFANSQGRACRMCDECTFTPGDDGTGVCFKAVAGPIDLNRVAMLGLVGGRVVYGGGGRQVDRPDPDGDLAGLGGGLRLRLTGLVGGPGR